MSTVNTYDRLLELFSGSEARFRVVSHEAEGRTDIVSQIRGNRLAQAAKAMVLRVRRTKADEHYFIAVVPGNCKVDLKAVKLCCGGDASFAAPEIAAELTGCVMGAVPPVSFHKDLKVVMDSSFLQEHEIVFNAGALDKSIFISTEDFIGATNPKVASISKVLEL